MKHFNSIGRWVAGVLCALLATVHMEAQGVFGQGIFKGDKQQFFGKTSSKASERGERVRTLTVCVAGEVAVPGSYQVASTASMLDVLYSAGGVNGMGSLRSVALMRSGKQVATLDVYDLLLAGEDRATTHLKEGDVLFVPPYQTRVSIGGHVNRPATYELKAGETMNDLLTLARGFAHDAFKDHVALVRLSSTGRVDYTVDEGDYPSFALQDGDGVTVLAMKDRFENRIEVKGAVWRPGVYALNDEVHTVGALIGKAQGVTEEAFTRRALLHRTREDLYKEVIAVDVDAVMAGQDIELAKNDVLYIPSIHDLHDLGHVSISGDVARPGSFAFAEGMTVEDLVLLAGGLTESASTGRVDISRRLKDAGALKAGSEVGQLFTIALSDSLSLTRSAFTLEPYDEVRVRRSPGTHMPGNVYAAGELTFAGPYALHDRAERLSDLVRRAGGLREGGYAEAALLARRTSADERFRQARVNTLDRFVEDSLQGDASVLKEMYYVDIDLKEALAHPGSDADLTLRQGDVLLVPRYVGTVSIQGQVMHANTVGYRHGENLKYYINQAGGYAKGGKRKRVYIVHLNGHLEHVKRGRKANVTPGSEIVVMAKRGRDPLNTTELLTVQRNAQMVQRHTTVIRNTLK